MKTIEEIDAEIEHEVKRDIAAEKAARRAEQWPMVLSAVDRAIAWVKANQDHLAYFDLRLTPHRKYGVEVRLGFGDESAERDANIKALFSGKRVTKVSKSGDCTECYTVDDEEAQLRFTWTIWDFSKLREDKRVEESYVV